MHTGVQVFQKFYITDSRPKTTDSLPKDSLFEVLQLMPTVAQDL